MNDLEAKVRLFEALQRAYSGSVSPEKVAEQVISLLERFQP